MPISEYADEADVLTGEETGRWWVMTGDQLYNFDLDRRTVTVFPRYSLQPGDRGHAWPLGSIASCVLGSPGDWMIHLGPVDATGSHLLCRTTPIERIIRIPDGQNFLTRYGPRRRNDTNSETRKPNFDSSTRVP